MTTDESQMWVRGISLISIREYVKSRLGEEGLEGFFSRFPKGEPEIILSAQKGEWYPFKLQQHLREQVVLEFNPKDPRQAIYDMVVFTANYEISIFLKAILAYLPVKLVLKKTADIWDKYYRPGRMELVNYNGDSACFEVKGFAHDELFCPTMYAWLKIAGQNMGFENTKIVQTACIHEGDALCRWEVSWISNNNTPSSAEGEERSQ